jgi:hypothetical protein
MAGSSRLGEAIEAYRAKYEDKLDVQARKLLKRLAASRNAADAFNDLDWLNQDDHEDQHPHNRKMLFLKACIESEQLAHTFQPLKKKLQNELVQLKQLRKSANDLRSFLGDKNKQTGIISEQLSESDKMLPHLLSRQLVPLDEIEAMGHGLALLEMRVATAEDVAKLNLFRLRVMRKSQSNDAGRIAAIKWLAHSVKELKTRATGNLRIDNPNMKQIADLAQVILGGDVSIEQVRAALRGREPWKWVVPKVLGVARSPSKSRPNAPER